MTESKRPQKGHIFISYRRIDSAGYAGRIYDRLVERFGEDAIFMDVDTIEGGVDFVKVLEDAVQSCDVLVALIGRQWLSIKDASGKRRLDNPEDFVRIEVATALKRDIRVIPVLVDGVDMPQPNELPENIKALARRNALQVNHHSFNPDVYRLIEHSEIALDEAEELRVKKAQALQAERDKDAREKAEREAAEKATREKEEREIAEKAARAKEEKKAARRAELTNLLSKLIPSTKFVIVIGVISALLWIASWAIPKLSPATPKVESTEALAPQTEPATISASPVIEIESSPTLSITSTPSITNTPEVVDERSFNVEHLETISVENLPNLTQLALFTYDGNFLTMSPSGKMMITDGGLIYDVETQKVICAIGAIKQNGEDEFALSDQLAIPSNGNVIWSLPECIRTELKSDLGRPIAIAPNNEEILFRIFNSDFRHILVHFDLENGEEIKRMMLGSSMSDITFSPDGVDFVASTGGGYAQTYTVSDFTFRSRFAASNLWANIISYRPDKDVLITSNEYPTTKTNIRVWNMSTGKIIYSIPDTTKISSGILGLSSDGKMYVASNDKKLSFWSIDTDVEAYTLELDKLTFGSVFSNNQKILLVLLDGNRIAVYGVNPE